MGVIIVSPDQNSGGTVINFSSGNLSPLFNTSVLNPTTTPAQSFAQIAQAANIVFAGPASGANANPTFRALVHADLPGIITVTVAQAQALAAVNGFFPGTVYHITNVMGSIASMWFIADSVNTLSNAGWGELQNLVMASPVEIFAFYNLAGDIITDVQDTQNNNRIIATNVIPAFKFDAYLGNFLQSCTFAGDGIENYSSFNYNRLYYCNILVGFGDTFTNNTADTFSYFLGTVATTFIGNNFMYSSSYFSGSSVAGAHSIQNCLVGPGKTIDCTAIAAAYSQNGKSFISNVSTFEVTGNEYSQINPSGLNVSDLAGSLGWVGIFTVTDGTNDLDQIANGPLDTIFWFRPAGGVTLKINDAALAGGSANIYLYVSGSTVSFLSSVDDKIQLQYGENILGYISLIERKRV